MTVKRRIALLISAILLGGVGLGGLLGIVPMNHTWNTIGLLCDAFMLIVVMPVVYRSFRK